jgi:hypothetical protein
MNTYLMTQLIETRHHELVDDAHDYRQARAARSSYRAVRRGHGRSRRSPASA